MPELFPKSEFAEEVKQAAKQKQVEYEKIKAEHPEEYPSKFLSHEEILDIAKRYNQKVINSGAECVVIPKEGSEDKVAAFTYKDIEPYRAKEIFYLQRIFSTLFPHNFPHFYASFGKNPSPEIKSLSGTIRQKIVNPVRAPENRHFFNNVLEACRVLGIGLEGNERHDPMYDRNDDPKFGNFMMGADGGVYYVDTLRMFDPNDFDTAKITEYMREHGHGETQITIVMESINRLAKLYNESAKK